VSDKTIPVQGSLKEYSVTRLLQIILEEQVSGSLTVSRGDTSRTLFLKDGMITYAASTESRDRLGEIFVIQGKLSKSEVRQAFEKARRKNTLLGRTLLVEGMITSHELFLAVTAQVVGILERMRSWRKGDFVFDVGGATEPGTVLLRIPLSLYLGVEEKKGKDDAFLLEEEDVLKVAADDAVDEEDVPEGLQFVGEGEEDDTFGKSDRPAPVEEARAEVGEEEPPGKVRDEDSAWGELELPREEEEEEEAEGEGDEGEVDYGARIEEIVFNVQEIRRRSGRDAHTVLGVHKGATATEIQDAYHYLAKHLHPDQRPPGVPEDVAREANELFREVTSAYHEAAMPAKEPPAAASAPTSISPPGRVTASTDSMVGGDQARNLFYRAKEQMANGNYWQATDSLRQVVRRKPREAMYRNLLGFCLMQTGRRLHEAEEHIREAIRLDPGNADYITNLGLVYKAGRFHSKAKDMFQQALIYDKRHKMARQELRVVSRLAETGGPKPMWRKIFGK